MVVLSSEIGTAIEISSIMWEKSPITSTNADCEGFSMYLGLSSAPTLSTGSFDGNYNSGTRTLVYSTSLLTIDMADPWAQIDLDTPYFYNGSDNLIIEIQWDNGTEDNSYYCNEWTAGANRCVYQQGGSGITSDSNLPHMMLVGTLALEGNTFGGIKVELGK